MKKFLSLFMVFVLALALVACGGKPVDNKPTDGSDEEEISAYDRESGEVYAAALGEFKEYYEKAKAATTVSERYALMAVAEAKLYESGAFLPTTSRGGNYAITRVAPKSTTTCLWGNDEYRLHSIIFVTGDKFITAAERAELKALWAVEAAKADGDYSAAAEAYLKLKGYTIGTEYKARYTSDPETWDVLSSSKQIDSEPLVNTYDGLLEYNNLNNQVGALATGYTVSDDGKTYTFTIRDGAIWVDKDGNKVADVKADDWVAGLQHMTDAQAGLDWLITGIVKGYGDYVEGKDSDFSHVGIKATDDKTLVIELEAPCSYFVTMLGYSCFAPLSRSYYESQGGKFGAAFDSSADSYNYGKDFEHIAYCGPYRITGFTSKNTVVFEKNDSYWNADAVKVTKITWYYDDATEVLKAYNDAVAGNIAGAGLNDSALQKAKEDKLDAYIYTTDTNATAFCGFWNINRAAYANASDATVAVSQKTDAQKADAKIALSNANFRLALSFAFNRSAWNALSVGEELKDVSLTNGYTPGNFVKLEKAVTLKIGGKDVTFPANTFYGEIVQAQLDADKCPIKYWDDVNKVSSGFDGWYNVENAKAYLAKAIEELKDKVTISAENPIYIDYPCQEYNEIGKNQANSLKQSIEAAFDGLVKVNLVACNSSVEYRGVGYSTKYGYEANYDLYTGSGWGPDYGDPSSYLDTMLPNYEGYMTKTLGIY